MNTNGSREVMAPGPDARLIRMQRRGSTWRALQRINEDSHASYPHAVAAGTGPDHCSRLTPIDKDVARLTQLLEKSQTLTARFSQLTLDGSGTQLQETAGDMAAAASGPVLLAHRSDG